MPPEPPNPSPTRSSNPFVTLRTFSDLAAAQLARTCLQAAGIDCHVAEEHIALMTQLDHSAVGGVKLRVRSSDSGWATEILGTPARRVE